MGKRESDKRTSCKFVKGVEIMATIKEMKQLINKLNNARNAYYNDSTSPMSDFEYDTLFDQLQSYENELGVVFPNSPTKSVGYEVVGKLNKVSHNHLMLSLDKTKSLYDVLGFAGKQDILMSLKLDGLTTSLRYIDGELISAETRGNGKVGEDVTHIAKVIANIPQHIPHKGELVVDGEVIIPTDVFNEINNALPENERYKTPRNLASGSLRQLDSKTASQRGMKFVAWKCVRNSSEYCPYYSERLHYLADIGFEIVPCDYIDHREMSKENVEEGIDFLKDIAERLYYPIDGIVITYNNVEYGESLGLTSHHPRHSLAFKFYDEEVTTRLLHIEWNTTRTGLVNPTAVFEPVEIDGTTVERATLHNVDYIKKLELGIGDEICVIKANQIIPKVTDNLTKSNTYHIPQRCPACGELLQVDNNGATVLRCTNSSCPAQLIDKFVHFVSRDGMNIEGLSEATLDKFIRKGWLKSFKDIYELNKYKDEIIQMDGFGEKSWSKMWNAIWNSRYCKLENFIYALGIEGIGVSAAKSIAKHCDYDFDTFKQYCFDIINDKTTMSEIDGLGNAADISLKKYCRESIALGVDEYLDFEKPKTEVKTDNQFSGKTVVVTGTLKNFTRKSITEYLENCGAKVSNSVSKKTDYLICGENAGIKLAKAQELGIKILDEKNIVEVTKK